MTNSWGLLKLMSIESVMPSNHLIYMALPIRTRPSFPLSLSHQEASISLLFFFIRGQTDGKPQSQETNHSDRVPDELWTEVSDIVQETGIKTIPMEKKCKKGK